MVLTRRIFSLFTSPHLTTRFFTPTSEHEALRDNLNKLIEKDINPHCKKWDKAKRFPAHEVFKKLGDAGYLGINREVEYGGLGLDYSYQAIASETFANIESGGVIMGIGVQCDITTTALSNHGSHELKQQFLAPTIAGDWVACLGVSEVGSGSDVASIKTKAVKQGEEYVINGGKMWTSNGAQADWICILANTSDGPVHRNKSLICVPMRTEGVKVHRTIDKMGMHASDTAEITFEDVRVPVTNLIGEEGKGFKYQMEQFQNERIYAAAGVIAGLDRAIAATIEYTSQRQAFGQSILDNQYVHYKIAEMQTEVECCRALYHKCLDDYLAGEDITPIASMLKLKSCRLARQVIDGCLQFWGGMGYTDDVMISKMYCDMRIMSIGAGADEVMLQIISKYMGIYPEGKP